MRHSPSQGTILPLTTPLYYNQPAFRTIGHKHRVDARWRMSSGVKRRRGFDAFLTTARRTSTA